MIIGIIAEYNPFHNGHIYHINKIKEKYPGSTIILVMSGNITQRGDISIINKWDKAEIALKYNIDLVVELPFQYACASADIFAYGAIKILNELKVERIIFGSEINDVNKLSELAKISLSDEYNNKVKKYLKSNSYAKATGIALKELSNYNLNTPNDILGYCYIREIIKNNYAIAIETIKRTNDYHSDELSNIASATSIRNAIIKNIDISQYVPIETMKKINQNFYLDNYFTLIKYKILSLDDLTIINDIDKKLANRLKSMINKANNLNEYIELVKSKNYTHSKIKRILIYILFDFKKSDNYLNSIYIKVLGFNNNGKQHLNKIKKEINLPIITNYSNSKGLTNLDIKINKILSLIYPLDKQNKIMNREKKEIIRII